MSDKPFRVLPELDDDNRFFWTSGQDGRLRFLRCVGCAYLIHPPVPVCPRCYGREVEPAAVSGRGTIHSYTVNHQPWDGSSEPYVIALVEIEDQAGLRLTSNLVDCDPADVGIGMPVEVVFEERDGVHFPLFRKIVSP